MGLETATYIEDLVATNPIGATDPKSEGDDHIKLIKAAVKATFPGLNGAAWRTQSKSAAYTVIGTDNMTVFYCTATLTLNLTAAATLGNKHFFIVHANSGTTTIDPAGAETINGAATMALEPGSVALVWCTGAGFVAGKFRVDGAPSDATITAAKLTTAMITGLVAETAPAVDDVMMLYDLSATGLRKMVLSDFFKLMHGKQTVWVPAGAMIPQATNGPSLGSVELSTNKQMIASLDFDPATIEYAQFDVELPKSYNAGTVTAIFVWSHAATTTNFGVAWALEGIAYGDAEAKDVAWGSAVAATDTGGTTNMNYRTVETTAMTLASSPAKQTTGRFRVWRSVNNASDTMAIDARLEGVILFFTTDAVNDA